MTYALSASEAGALATRGRQFRRRRVLTTHQAALLDTMLWVARRPGSGVLTASMAVLARLAGQARSTVIAGVRRLEELGFIRRIRRRVRVVWTGRASASRQAANAYVFRPDTETEARPAREQTSRILIMEPAGPATRMAQEALAARRRQVEHDLLRNEGAKPFSYSKPFPDMQKCSNNSV